MADWIRIGSLTQCPPGTAQEYVARDRMVAVFNVDGILHALDGVCPHQGGPLGKGTLEGDIVTCPWHGWQFNVCTGQHQLAESVRHPTIPIRVDDGEIYVQLDD
jgi:nitrite reductase (NADH) small subunit